MNNFIAINLKASVNWISKERTYQSSLKKKYRTWIILKSVTEMVQKFKNFTQENSRPRWFLCWDVAKLENTDYSYLIKLFKCVGGGWWGPGSGGVLSNTFHENTVNLIPKPVRDWMRKEKYRTISVMNIDAKYPHKIIANQLSKV